MQTLDDHVYSELEKVAKKRGITIQELLRAVVLPSGWTDKAGNRNDHCSNRFIQLTRPGLPRHMTLQSHGNSFLPIPLSNEHAEDDKNTKVATCRGQKAQGMSERR